MSSLIRTLTALACAAAWTSAQAQGYPAKTVRLVVPYSAGGASDTLARVRGDRVVWPIRSGGNATRGHRQDQCGGAENLRRSRLPREKSGAAGV